MKEETGMSETYTGLVGNFQGKRSVTRPNHDNIKVDLRITGYEDLTCTKWGPTAGFYEHSDERSGSVDSEF
jgi:hypothetical protein